LSLLDGLITVCVVAYAESIAGATELPERWASGAIRGSFPRLTAALATWVAAWLTIVVPAAPAAADSQKWYVSYALPIRTKGHVDADKTIDRLRALHVNAHMFLVSRRQDWDALSSFAAKAQQAGIKVWVFLHPPRWCKDAAGDMDRACPLYEPYHGDYAQWARAIARLSLRYPVVSAWVIDDFVGDDEVLTPAYMGRARAAGRAIRPTLEFYPLVYHQFVASFMRAYAPVIDALIMPFRDGVYRNTVMLDSLAPQLRADTALLARYRRKLVLMVYARSLSKTQVVPDVDYVRQVTMAGLAGMADNSLAGVIVYKIPLEPGQWASDDTNFARTGSGALVFGVRKQRATAAHDWAEARVNVAFNAGSTSCVMSFWHRDRYPVSPEKAGFHQKRLMANAAAGSSAKLLWHMDVMADDAMWHRVSVDLSPYVRRAGPLRLRLGLYETKGVGDLSVVVQIDDITFTGCAAAGGFDGGFETPGRAPFFARHGGPVLVGEHIADPVYSTTVFNMIERLFRH
jgi:hypothetical protein